MVIGLLLTKHLGLLFNKDTVVLTTFYGVFIYVIVSMPLSAVAFTLDAIFKGLGEMRYLRNVLLSATIFGFIPVLIVSSYMGWGLDGIWFALLVWIAIRAIALIFKYRSKYLILADKTPKV